jgi:hypothetical protein
LVSARQKVWFEQAVEPCAIGVTAAIGCSESLANSAPSEATALVGQNGRALPIDTLVGRYMQQKQVSGVVWQGHQRNGPAAFHCYLTDAKNRYPITPDTLFALGSLSKGTTAGGCGTGQRRAAALGRHATHAASAGDTA